MNEEHSLSNIHPGDPSPGAPASAASASLVTANTTSATPSAALSASMNSPFPVPPNANSILLQCIDTQRQLRASASLRESQYMQEDETKRWRLQLLRVQQQRREEQNRREAEAFRLTSVMLEELVVAVRDREVSLRPEGYQAFVFPNGDVYEGNWKGCRLHGKGCLRRADTKDLYEGQWFQGQRCGPGTLHAPDFQTLYSGAWLDNKRHGRGELVEAEGVYTGEFIDNRISGFGEYVYADGHVYRGDWRDGLYHGSGVYLYPSGSRYEGGWCMGYESGRGTRTFANGDVYSGEWHEGRPHGQGVYTTADFPSAVTLATTAAAAAASAGMNTAGGGSGGNATVFTGGATTGAAAAMANTNAAAASVVTGNGAFPGGPSRARAHGAPRSAQTRSPASSNAAVHTNNNTTAAATVRSCAFRYDGSWVCGTMQGMGTCLFGDGAGYTGEWWNGMPHGQGTVQFRHRPGFRAGHGFSKEADGGLQQQALDVAECYYAGGFHLGKRDGYGSFLSPLAQYTGEWCADAKHGHGTLKVSGTGTYEGGWRADLPHGEGVYLADNEAISFARHAREVDEKHPDGAARSTTRPSSSKSQGARVPYPSDGPHDDVEDDDDERARRPEVLVAFQDGVCLSMAPKERAPVGHIFTQAGLNLRLQMDPHPSM